MKKLTTIIVLIAGILIVSICNFNTVREAFELNTRNAAVDSKVINKENKYIKSELKIPKLVMNNKEIERILNKKFAYNENKLLEINFTNCVQVEDTNLNKYLHKKKSKGKIDMVMSMINALYLLQQQVVLGEDNSWSIQIC